jgi:hypothetical protein
MALVDRLVRLAASTVEVAQALALNGECPVPSSLTPEQASPNAAERWLARRLRAVISRDAKRRMDTLDSPPPLARRTLAGRPPPDALPHPGCARRSSPPPACAGSSRSS